MGKRCGGGFHSKGCGHSSGVGWRPPKTRSSGGGSRPVPYSNSRPTYRSSSSITPATRLKAIDAKHADMDALQESIRKNQAEGLARRGHVPGTPGGSNSSQQGINQDINLAQPGKQGYAGRSGSYYVNPSWSPDGKDGQLHIHEHSDGSGTTYSNYEGGQPTHRKTERNK